MSTDAAQIANLERRIRAAIKAGLPARLGARLKGDSQAELDADALAFAEVIGVTREQAAPRSQYEDPDVVAARIFEQG